MVVSGYGTLAETPEGSYAYQGMNEGRATQGCVANPAPWTPVTPYEYV